MTACSWCISVGPHAAVAPGGAIGLRAWVSPYHDCAQLPMTLPVPACRCLFSGGWDYAVRIWARHGLACAGTLAFDDWVWCVAPRGDNLLVSAGVKVHVHDLGTGRQLRRYENPHGVNVSLPCIGSRAWSGR